MSQLRPTHRCQIDCTNHDEVINNLELKSKDLYYFWRNYEWLYTKYEQLLLKEKEVPEPQRSPQIIKEIVKVKENHDKCNHQIQELENHKERLEKQNKNLKRELESCRRQIQQLQNNNKYEVEYKKQITFLKNKSADLQGIIDKQLVEIGKFKSQRKSIEEEYDNQKIRLGKQSKKLKQTIIQLEQRLDQLRNKSVPSSNPPLSKNDGLNYLQLEEFKSRQTTILSSKLSILSQQAQKLISIQCDSMKRQFQEQLQDALLSMSQRQLSTIIQFIQQ